MNKSNNKIKYPASIIQRQFWLVNQLHPESAAYNISSSFNIMGNFNPEIFAKSINELIKRHEIYRTTFINYNGELKQEVSKSEELEIPVEDLSGLSKEEQNSSIEKILQAEDSFQFDLSKWPIFRVRIFKTEKNRFIVSIVIHHILIDLTSKELFSKELSGIYNTLIAHNNLSPNEPHYQYRDYCEWQIEFLTTDNFKHMLYYWKDILEEKNCIQEFPADKIRPQLATLNGKSCPFHIDQQLYGNIKEFCNTHRTSVFLVLLSVYFILHYRYCGQEEIIIGVPLTNRREKKQKDIHGCFVNILPIAVSFSNNPSFKSILNQVRQRMLEAHRNQEVPYELIVKSLPDKRNARLNPLFQSGFTFEPPMFLSLNNTEIKPIIIDSKGSQLDIFLRLYESNNSINGQLEYNTDTFEEQSIVHITNSYLSLLQSSLSDPEKNVAALPLLSKNDLDLLLLSWNATDVTYPEDICLHQLIEKQVEISPENTAIRFKKRELSYKDFNNKANILAHTLISRGAGPETIIGVYMERSLEMVIALVAILKSGGAYLPLDPSLPEKRIEFTIEDSKITLILTQEHLKENIPEIDRSESIESLIVNSDELADSDNSENPECKSTQDNLAYVIYTSGSTGQPKGAEITHSGICNRLLWMKDEYGLSHKDRILQKTPFGFDVSVWEFFLPLMSGSCLVVAEPEAHRDNSYLIKTIKDENITIIHFVPSMLNEFLEEPGAGECTTLRDIICSGEELPVSVQNKFFNLFSSNLHNLYGPTEASIDVTAYKCKKNSRTISVPIGKPVANTYMYILDPFMNLLPPGIYGELYISGRQLARGYLNREELTCERFLPNPYKRGNKDTYLYKTGDLARWLNDGNIEFAGRTDRQIQLMGHRVELGEIESHCDDFPGINKSAVIAKEYSPGDTRLMAYLIADAKSSIDQNKLRQFLGERVPAYMVPSFFLFLDAFPLSHNGKLDISKLPDPDWNSTAHDIEIVAPRNDIQRTIASVWKELLTLNAVSINDNFFDLGGTSLLMIQSRRMLSALLREEVDITHLFRYPTIHSLSEYLLKKNDTSPIDNKTIERIDRQKKSYRENRKLADKRKKE
jgi:amino acid adenylation domain-containing protein